MVMHETTHDGIQDLPMRKAKQSRPTREEILEGIGYEPDLSSEPACRKRCAPRKTKC